MKVTELFGCFCLTFLAAFTSGVRIHCDFIISNWHIGSVYGCDATVISLEDPARITEVSGTHWVEKNDADVKGFHIDGQNSLSIIPSGIQNFFFNLEAFQWWNGNISRIDSSTFASIPNLLSIHLFRNKLVTLDGDVFQNTRKLQRIYLQSNLLEHVGYDLLTGRTDLTYADFSSNPCIDVVATSSLQIQELSRQLLIQCPPTVTTTIAPPTTTEPPTTTTDPPTTTFSTTTVPSACPALCTSTEETQEIMNRVETLERQIREIQIPIIGS